MTEVIRQQAFEKITVTLRPCRKIRQ